MAVDITIAVADLLRSRTPITDLTTRISSDRLIQGTSGRAIVIWVISETAHEALDGPIGLDQARLQINAYGDTRPDADELAWTIWTEIAGYSGVISQVFIKGVSRVTGVRFQSDRVSGGTDQYRYIAVQDLLFSYCSGALVT